ncbi:MAG: ribosome biogenesis GTPase Der [Alphaproteobacteria bacterium]|nr:ribosome biogenesis GTPase Der [Alphaproteobacteria bacterium]
MHGDSKDLPLVALVGRPNVGKSTLFNRLVGKRLALVHNQPGVTRDRKEAVADFIGLTFRVIDTPGLMDPSAKEITKELSEGMRQQTLSAIKSAKVVLFVIDGIEGCTPYDLELSRFLRQQNKPIIVLVNKSEGKHSIQGISDAASLGLGEPIAVSAEHGLGMSDLEFALRPFIDTPEIAEEFEEEDEGEREKRPLNLAIMGRPNVGKSTLVNTLLGEKRQLTADMPGVTRDAIALSWEFEGRSIQLVDTAGIRRQSRVQEAVERLAVMDAQRTLRFADVVVLVIDGSLPERELIEKQDLALASEVIEEGRALILAINKWDMVQKKEQLLKHLREQLDVHFAQARGIACVPISALKEQNMESLMKAVFKVEKAWNRRLPTAELNRWLQFKVDNHPAPIVSGKRIRPKYMTQIKSRPPTFMVFTTKAGDMPDSYKRYLINGLREDFDMPGIPIRVNFKSSKNPYDTGKS